MIDEVGRYLGIAAAQLVSILNIERIVITGSVARFGQPLRDVIGRELLKRALPPLAQTTEIVVVEEQPDTILLGISALLLNHELGLIRLAPRTIVAIACHLRELLCQRAYGKFGGRRCRPRTPTA